MIDGAGRTLEQNYAIETWVDAIAPARQRAVLRRIDGAEIGQSRRLVSQTRGGRQSRIGDEVDIPRLLQVVAFRTYVGQFHYEIPQHFPLHAEAPLLDHGISQISIDCRADRTEVQRRSRNPSDLAGRLLLYG